MEWLKGVLGAAVAFVPLPAAAQEAGGTGSRPGPEVALGLLAHGIRRPWIAAPPGDAIYEGEEERGTVDVQLVYRTAPLAKALHPRLTARLQLNTAGRTDFASVGAEWRQHILRGRVYGQAGIGLTIQDGYRYVPNPFAAGLSADEAWRRYDIYARRTGFGSRVLFNPNLSLGVQVTAHWAIEVAFEHFSHRRLFSTQNPGIDTVGLRFVRALGRW